MEFIASFTEGCYHYQQDIVSGHTTKIYLRSEVVGIYKATVAPQNAVN